LLQKALEEGSGLWMQIWTQRQFILMLTIELGMLKHISQPKIRIEKNVLNFDFLKKKILQNFVTET